MSYYWIMTTIVCCVMGYLAGIRLGLDGKVGVSLGLAFSILFSTGLYVQFRSYDPPLKLMLVVFFVLVCLTLLRLLERRTLVAWLQLATLTFLISVFAHYIAPNPTYIRQAELALNYLSKASGIPAPDLSSLIAAVEHHTAILTDRLSKEPSTLVKVKSDTPLLDDEGRISKRINAGTWAVLGLKTVKHEAQQLAQVEILNEEGLVTQVGYVDESAIGLKVIVPPEDKKGKLQSITAP